jgi:hypothetical protein
MSRRRARIKLSCAELRAGAFLLLGVDQVEPGADDRPLLIGALVGAEPAFKLLALVA